MDELLVINDWIRDRILGEGTFGRVTLWKHSKNGERVATKICKWGDNPELKPKHRERWSKEVDMVAKMKCPNIVQAKPLPPGFAEHLSICNLSKLPILCMEYCSGGDLRQTLSALTACCGLPEIQIRHILNDLRNAIHYLHKSGITHRDLKPENIVMQTRNVVDQTLGLSSKHPFVYKLIDLGYAKELNMQSQCASFVGTLQYIAPEIILTKPYSNSVDYWSFGLVAFEIICGVRPFLPYKTYSTVDWMKHVANKPNEVICIFENVEETVQSSRLMFSENHISSVFKKYMEEWLCAALEWDPKRRGYNSDRNGIIIFDFLAEIIAKKIITVFSVWNFAIASYEIDDTVLISTIQTRILSDFQIEISDQLLIPLNGSVIKPDDPAAEYYDIDNEIMFFLFNKSKLMNATVNPVVPNNIRICLKDGVEMNLNNRSNLYRNVCYFVHYEKSLFDNLALAFLVLSKYLRNKISNMFLLQNNTHKEIVSMIAQRDILASIVENDRAEMNHIGASMNKDLVVYGACLTSAAEPVENANRLLKGWERLEVRIESVTRRYREVNDSEVYQTVIGLSKLRFENETNRALAAYDEFKRTEKETRGGARMFCRKAICCVYDALRERVDILDRFIRLPIAHKLYDINKEIAAILDLLKSTPPVVKERKIEIMKCILESQKMHWTIIHNLQGDQLAEELPYPVCNFDRGNFKMEAINSKNSVSPMVSNSIDPVLSPMLQQNFSIIQDMQNGICMSFNEQKEIIEAMDYQFLDE